MIFPPRPTSEITSALNCMVRGVPEFRWPKEAQFGKREAIGYIRALIYFCENGEDPPPDFGK